MLKDRFFCPSLHGARAILVSEARVLKTDFACKPLVLAAEHLAVERSRTNVPQVERL